MNAQTAHELELGKLAPAFRLQTTDNRSVSIWDYKERKNLVILFFDPMNERDLDTLRQFGLHYDQLAEANAEVLALADGPSHILVDRVSSLRLPFPVLSDSAREARRAYGVTKSSMFVLDRFGALRMQAPVSWTVRHTLDQATGILELVELECPECGAPAWEETG